MEKHNGKIDLLKFIFAFFIMTLHYKWRPVVLQVGSHQIILAQSGFYAVIFFFIVSGALFAISAQKKQHMWCENISTSNIASDVQTFIVRKYCSFIPWYLGALCIYILIDLIIDLVSLKNVISNLFWSIPSFLMLGYTGFDTQKGIYQGGYYVGASWYISALMILYCLFFPIIRWSYDVFVRVISPALIIIFLYINVSVLNTNITQSNCGPFIPFLFGVIIGDISIRLCEGISRNKLMGRILTVTEVLGYVILTVFLCVDYSNMPMVEYPLLFIVGFSVLISLSYTNSPALFEKKIFKVLGKLSMIIYLFHIPIGLACSKIIYKLYPSMGGTGIYFISVFMTMIVAVIAYTISELFKEYKII